MKIVQYHDPRLFAQRTQSMLLAHEVENGFLLGMIAGAVKDFPNINPHLLMLTIEADSDVAAVVMQTRAEDADLTQLEPEHIAPLIAKLSELNWPLRGIIAPSETTDAFAERWCKVKGCGKRAWSLRMLKLETLIPPAAVSGNMIQATLKDLDVVVEFRTAFAHEIYEAEPRGEAERLIREKRLFLWHDSDIRAMAGIAGPTPNGIRVNSVCTPPQFRRRGYASNLVAAVSRRMLESGRKFCFLFTNAANPTSNHIYEQIGYHHVGDFKHWTFE